MRLDNLLGDRKAKPRIVAEIGLGTLRVEAFEDLGQGFIRDTRSGILDHDKNTVFPTARPDADRVAILAKADGVGDQVDENLRQTRFESMNLYRSVRQVGNEFDTLALGVLAKELRQVAKHFQEVELGLFFLDQFAVKSRRVGYIADQTVQATDIVIDHVEKAILLVGPTRDTQCADSGTQRGQRILDFMRHVSGKLFIGVDPVIERRDHAAQRAGQSTDFIR